MCISIAIHASTEQVPGHPGRINPRYCLGCKLPSTDHHHQQNQQDDNDDGQKNKLIIPLCYFVSPDHNSWLISGNNMELNNSL